MVGCVMAHEVVLIVTPAPFLTFAGVKCERTTRSSFIHSIIAKQLVVSCHGALVWTSECCSSWAQISTVLQVRSTS
jgi:hypothetical protein